MPLCLYQWSLIALLLANFFLKAMLPQNTRGHKLDELFSALDNTIQENIKMRTIDEMKKTTSGYCDYRFSE